MLRVDPKHIEVLSNTFEADVVKQRVASKFNIAGETLAKVVSAYYQSKLSDLEIYLKTIGIHVETEVGLESVTILRQKGEWYSDKEIKHIDYEMVEETIMNDIIENIVEVLSDYDERTASALAA